MNVFLSLLILLLAFSIQAKTPKNMTSENLDKEERPAETRRKQSQKFQERPSSMGGAPNIGAGMGTGTGAGSTVGKDVEAGSVSSGATSGDEEE